MKITDLTKAMNSLNRQIKSILRDSGFDGFFEEFFPDEFDTNRKTVTYKEGYTDDVPDLTADEWQLVRDYSWILGKLDIIFDRLSYLSKPVVHEGTLSFCSNDRYACDYYEFTCGSRIEYQKYDEYHDCYYWTISRVEYSDDKDGYYIYGDSSTQLDGLRVRFRF